MTGSTPKPRWTFFFAIALVTIVIRLIPQWLVRLKSSGYDMSAVDFSWGFTTAMAVGLFAGAFIRDLPKALGLTLGIQVVGDLAIGLLSRDLSQGLTMGMLPIYISYTLIALLGRPLGVNRAWWRVAGSSLLAPALFFVVTNFAVWAGSHAGARMYPLTLQGLLDCFEAGIPFSDSFVSSLVCSLLLFSPLGVSLAVESKVTVPTNEAA